MFITIIRGGDVDHCWNTCLACLRPWVLIPSTAKIKMNFSFKPLYYETTISPILYERRNLKRGHGVQTKCSN